LSIDTPGDIRRRLTTLREERAEALEKAEAISERAVREQRDLRPDEHKEYKKHFTVIDGLNERITKLSDDAIFGSDGGLTRGQVLPARKPVRGDGTGDGTARGNDLRSQALNTNEQADTVPDAARQNMAVALENESDPDSRLARYVVAAGDPAYESAFRKWMRDPMSGHYEWTPQERAAYAHTQAEARAMSLGTTTAGGFLVSYSLDPQVLISGAGSINPIRQIARVQLVSENVNKFVTAAGVTASWDAEGAEVSDDTPTLAQPSITCRKGQAFVPLSYELMEDSPDIGRQIQKLFVDAKAQLEATAFTTGNGTTEPKGIVTAVSAVGGSVVTAAGAAVALADIIANQNALPPRWRPNARFMANLSVINAARQLPAGSGLTTSIVDDSTNPPRMLGWDLHENSQLDGTIAGGTTDDFVLLSGDFYQYIIADRVGTSVEFIQNLFGASQRPTGQRGFILHWRTGADAVIPDAFRLTNYSA
jgi:HK97 family phage major capsid protein